MLCTPMLPHAPCGQTQQRPQFLPKTQGMRPRSTPIEVGIKIKQILKRVPWWYHPCQAGAPEPHVAGVATRDWWAETISISTSALPGRKEFRKDSRCRLPSLQWAQWPPGKRKAEVSCAVASYLPWLSLSLIC